MDRDVDNVGRCPLTEGIVGSPGAIRMIGLHLGQVFDGICFLAIVYHRVMLLAHQDQVVVPVSLGGCLLVVVAWSLWFGGFDVANVAYNHVTLDKHIGATGKGAAIPRESE
jgi:hypothetical protein